MKLLIALVLAVIACFLLYVIMVFPYMTFIIFVSGFGLALAILDL